MRAALAFLTTLGGARGPEPGSLPWFPLVGLGIGSLVGAGGWGAAELWPPLAAAVVVVAADAALTGLLHVDGLADAADGLFVHGATPARRLEIMRTPDVGAFGTTAVTFALLGRVAGFATMAPEPLLVAGLWTASRTVMAVSPALLPYARREGLATGFLQGPPRRWPAVGLLVAAAFCVLAAGWGGAAALLALLVTAAGVLLLAKQRLGGFTGDVLGATAVAGETVALLVASARW